MSFNLKNLNKATRFNYPDAEGDEWVELRLVSAEKMDEFRKELKIKPKSKYIVNTLSKRMETVQDIDIPDEKIAALGDLYIDYQISAWNLVEPDGEEIPCTLENKKILMSGEPMFNAWVTARLNKLQGDIAEIENGEIKN